MWPWHVKMPTQNLLNTVLNIFLSDPGPIIVWNSLTHSLTTLSTLDWFDPCWLGYIDAYVGKYENSTIMQNMKICELCKICNSCKRRRIIKRCRICRLWKTKATKSMLRNQKYRTKYANLNLPIQTYQTHQTKHSQPNLPNQTYQTKPTELNRPTWICI